MSKQSIALVDEEVDSKNAKANERSKWTTQRGFQYPPPKKNKVTKGRCFITF